MANFEFTQNLSFGQYLPTGSWVHNRDARARIIIYFTLLLAITIARHAYMVIAALIFIIAGFHFSKIPLRYALNGLKTPLPFLVFLSILQLFRFAPDSANLLIFSIGPLTITTQGIIAGFVVLARFITLILVISLTSFTLSTSDLIYGLQSLLRPLNWLGIPSEDIIMVFQITLRFLPMLGQSTEQIAKAQAARGAAWGIKKQNLIERVKTIYPVIIPMFLTSLQKAENMALAMDARGYGTHLQRGTYKQFEFKMQDGLSILAVLIVCILIIVL
jgi:energy-coupling factor transport system permease protein